MKKWVLWTLNKGTQYVRDPADKRRVRLFNLLLYGHLIFPIPVLIVVNLVSGDTFELLALAIIVFLLIVSLALNAKGWNQPTVIILTLIIITLIYIISINTQTQTGAPYGLLLAAFTSVLLIRNRSLRILLLFLSVVSFVITNYIQLKYQTFSEAEYFVVLMMLLLIFIGMVYYDNQMVSYQETIEKQSKALLRLEKERHQREVELKQKDLEMMVTIAFAKDKLNRKLTHQLKEVLSGKDPRKGIRKVIQELNAQRDLINKQSLINHHIDEVNADFYDRLYQKFPNLTKGERELCSYLKLSLSNKEIATIRNMTENSVNVSKARLRKKMKLSSNKELQRFLLHF